MRSNLRHCDVRFGDLIYLALQQNWGTSCAHLGASSASAAICVPPNASLTSPNVAIYSWGNHLNVFPDPSTEIVFSSSSRHFCLALSVCPSKCLADLISDWLSVCLPVCLSLTPFRCVGLGLSCPFLRIPLYMRPSVSISSPSVCGCRSLLLYTLLVVFVLVLFL